jgi:hypothetical protein
MAAQGFGAKPGFETHDVVGVHRSADRHRGHKGAGAGIGSALPSSLLPAALGTGHRRVTTLDQLAQIPEEEIWLSKQKSARTRCAYRLDVQHFIRTLSITTSEESRQGDHKAVIAWERDMREVEQTAASTIRRRLAALSSLYSTWCATGTPAATRSARSNGRRSIVTNDQPWPSRKRRRANCSTRRRRTQLPTCAIGRSCRSACRWVYGDAMTAWCENMRPNSGSTAATRHTRCARHSSRRRSKTAPSSRTCRRPPGTAIRVRPSSTTGAGTIRRRQRCSLFSGRGDSVQVLGWSTNLQSSRGVTREFRNLLASWLRGAAEFDEADREGRHRMASTQGSIDAAGYVIQGTTLESKDELFRLLRSWLQVSDMPTIGDFGDYGRRPWIFITFGRGRSGVLNADTKRAAIEKYVKDAQTRGANVPWLVIPNSRTHQWNKLVFEKDHKPTPGWYCYLQPPNVGPEEI